MRDHHQARILLVEDDEAQREVVTEILQLEGMQVAAVESARDAEAYLDPPPHLVMMDLHGVAVDDLVARVRTLQPRPKMLVLSGDLKLRQLAEGLGADAWLGKPYDVEDLLAAIQRMLGPAVPAGMEAGEHGPAERG